MAKVKSKIFQWGDHKAGLWLVQGASQTIVMDADGRKYLGGDKKKTPPPGPKEWEKKRKSRKSHTVVKQQEDNEDDDNDKPLEKEARGTVKGQPN